MIVVLTNGDVGCVHKTGRFTVHEDVRLVAFGLGLPVLQLFNIWRLRHLAPAFIRRTERRSMLGHWQLNHTTPVLQQLTTVVTSPTTSGIII